VWSYMPVPRLCRWATASGLSPSLRYGDRTAETSWSARACQSAVAGQDLQFSHGWRWRRCLPTLHARYTEEIDSPDPERRRVWEFESPVVVFDDAVSGLDQQVRDKLNDLEQG